MNSHFDKSIVNIESRARLAALLRAVAVALLPPFARSMLGLERPGLAALPARAATWGMGKTLRWAFRQS